ncbi:MAG: AtpZ/AtpI family protein [Bacteroidota bacterium]
MLNSPRDNSGDSNNNQGNRRELYRYASLSSQVVASVGLSIFIGVKADKWVSLSFPIFSWALPLLVIVVLIIKLIKEISRNKDGK